MQTAVVVFPGSNRERDAIMALERATGKKPHIVWHGDSELPKVDLIVLPGGFSYGDYLRTGAMAAHSPIMREVAAQANKGVRVWGICNGFQILCEAQLVSGILLRNASLKFICKPVTLSVESANSDFTRLCKKGQDLRVIVAHGDGNYFAANDAVKQMEDNDQIAFRYRDNPNGSLGDIAGVFNKQRNVLGMMPHPEDAVEPLHGSLDGRLLFELGGEVAAMKLVLTFLMLLGMAGTANAVTMNGREYPDKWFKCYMDTECVVQYGCVDFGINRIYEHEAEKLFEGCNGSSRHNPDVVARCVEGQCKVPEPENKK